MVKVESEGFTDVIAKNTLKMETIKCHSREGGNPERWDSILFTFLLAEEMGLFILELLMI